MLDMRFSLLYISLHRLGTRVEVEMGKQTVTGEEIRKPRVINTREIVNYIRRQMRAGHSDLMALDMAANKFGLSANAVIALAGVL